MSTLAALGRPESKFQHLIKARTAAVMGVIGAIATVLIARLPEVGLVLGCLSVALLYAAYPTFSLAWGSARERVIEWTFMSFGIVSIFLAVSVDPRWLALGWGLHGIWDGLHHRDHHIVGLRGIPLWYIQTCLVWDLPAAIGLLVFM